MKKQMARIKSRNGRGSENESEKAKNALNASSFSLQMSSIAFYCFKMLNACQDLSMATLAFRWTLSYETANLCPGVRKHCSDARSRMAHGKRLKC